MKLMVLKKDGSTVPGISKIGGIATAVCALPRKDREKFKSTTFKR